MRTVFQFKSRLMVFLSAIIFISCSQEEPILETEQNSEFETFYEIIKGDNNLTKTTASACAKENVLLQSATAGIEVGSSKYKTLNTFVYQDLEGITISARYLIDNNLGLPAQISLYLEDKEVVFKDKTPGALVSHTFPYPDNWEPGDELNYKVDQTVYLSPISVTSAFQLLPLCEINVGENLFGGIVAYIYQPGDEKYVEGETHGIILNPDSSFEGNWFDAVEWVSNLNYNNYNDWSLPNIEELEILMNTYPLNFSYVNTLNYGFWSSTEYDALEGFAYIGTYTGLISSDDFQPQPLNKSTGGTLTRVIRHF